MKVAIIIPALVQVGPVKLMETLVNSLNGIENLWINVFYLDKAIDPHLKIMAPVEKLNRKTFRFGDYDIIHTNGIRPDLFAFINRKKIKYHISTLHNFVFEDLRHTYNRFFSFLFGNIWLTIWRKTDKLVCVSDEMKEYYAKWFAISKLDVIHNGIPDTDNSLKPDEDVIQVINGFKSKGFKVIGSIGILTKRKGIDQILKLVKVERGVALIIIGDGKEITKLKNLAEKLKISDRCFFCGFRTNAVSYIRYFDSFIMASRSEGFGLALIEAVQQKVPIVCSDISVFRELFTRSEVTFFKLEDVNSLSLALKEAINNGTGKVHSAFSRYQLNYKSKIMAYRYLELYQSCLSA
jgi:L-malate glycosyltransferase